MGKHKNKIVTEHVRDTTAPGSYDWVAYRDGEYEDGPHGWGATEEHAIADLNEHLEEITRENDHE